MSTAMRAMVRRAMSGMRAADVVSARASVSSVGHGTTDDARRGVASSSNANADARGDGDGDVTSTAMSKRYTNRRILKGVTREALCDVVADVERYAEFVPFCARAARTPRGTWRREEQEKAEARGAEYFEADLEIGFKIFSERYTSAVTCERPRRVTARSVSSGLFESMTTTWTFTPLDGEEEDGGDSEIPSSDGVIVDFEIDFAVRDPMHAAAVGVVFDDVARSQIQAFEKRCRQLALKKLGGGGG